MRNVRILGGLLLLLAVSMLSNFWLFLYLQSITRRAEGWQRVAFMGVCQDLHHVNQFTIYIDREEMDDLFIRRLECRIPR